jgi:hypothetical protein
MNTRPAETRLGVIVVLDIAKTFRDNMFLLADFDALCDRSRFLRRTRG